MFRQMAARDVSLASQLVPPPPPPPPADQATGSSVMPQPAPAPAPVPAPAPAVTPRAGTYPAASGAAPRPAQGPGSRDRQDPAAPAPGSAAAAVADSAAAVSRLTPKEQEVSIEHGGRRSAACAGCCGYARGRFVSVRHRSARQSSVSVSEFQLGRSRSSLSCAARPPSVLVRYLDCAKRPSQVLH